MAEAQVDVVAGSARGESWAVVVRAGRLGTSRLALLTDLFDRRVVRATTGAPLEDRALAESRVRA